MTTAGQAWSVSVATAPTDLDEVEKLHRLAVSDYGRDDDGLGAIDALVDVTPALVRELRLLRRIATASAQTRRAQEELDDAHDALEDAHADALRDAWEHERTQARIIQEREQQPEDPTTRWCAHCGDATEPGDDPRPDLCALCAKAGRK